MLVDNSNNVEEDKISPLLRNNQFFFLLHTYKQRNHLVYFSQILDLFLYLCR